MSKKLKYNGKVILNSGNKIIIDSLSFENSDVYDFLSDKDNKEEFVIKALVIGSIGLKNMIVGDNLHYIEKKFSDFMREVDDKFKLERDEIKKKIDDVFSIDNKTSAVSKLYQKIEQTFNEDDKKSPMGKLVKHLETYFDDKKGVIKTITHETFDINNKDSPLGKFIEKLTYYFDDENGILKKTLDVENKKSPLGKLVFNLDNYFDEKRGILPKMLQQTFNIENKQSPFGKFALLLEENFDVEKGKIKKLLDPHKADSPLKQLRDELMTNLQEIKEAIKKTETEAELISKTALKGSVFEDYVNLQLELVTAPYDDNFEDVTNKQGRLGKAGDFVVFVDRNKSRKIVVECKDLESCTKNKADNYLDDAIKNRDAKFGILLFKLESQIPNAYRPIKITDKGIITSFDKNGLYFAYRLAKMLFEKEMYNKNNKIPIDKIESEIKDLITQCKIIDDILRENKKISNASDYIQNNLSVLHTHIEEGLLKIERLIKA